MPFGFLLLHALDQNPGPFLNFSLPQPLIIAVLYGLSDETHQIFVPGRYFDLADLLADACGIYLGCISYLLIRKYSQQPVKISTHE